MKNIQNNFVKKGLVFGIIILFVSFNVVSGISIIHKNNEDYTKDFVQGKTFYSKDINIMQNLDANTSYRDNYSEWQPTNGPTGKLIRCFVSLGNDVFAGTCGGVFMTSNNGSLWTPMNNGLTSRDVKYFVTINDSLFVSTDEGVFVSNNHGSNWTMLDNGLRKVYIKSMTVSGNHIFAGSYTKGIFVSSNFGSLWVQANEGLTNMYIYTMSSDEQKILAGTYGGGVFLSTDLGQNWSDVNNGLPSNGNIFSVKIIDDYMLACVLYYGLYKSINSGQSWTLVSSSMTMVREFVKINNLIFAGTGSGVFKSADEGETWTPVNNGLSDTNVWSLGSAGTNLYAGVGSGQIFFSSNLGANWIPVNNGLSIGTLIGSLVINNNKIFAASHGSNLYATTNEGTTWSPVSGIGTVEIRTLAVNQGNLYVGTDLLGLFVSINNGASFSAINNGITSKWVHSLCFTDNYIFAGTGEKGVFRSVNGGASWTPVNTGLTSGNIVSLCIAGNFIFAGTDDQGIFRTSNNGTRWISVNDSLPTGWIETLFYDGNFLFAGTGDAGMFRSSNFGENWTQINNGLQGNYHIRSLISSQEVLFCGTNTGGVFYSLDEGLSWDDINTGLGNMQDRSLLINETNLFSGTNADGVWKRSINDILGLISIYIDLNLQWNLITIPVDNNWMASSLAGNITGCQMISWFDAVNQTYKTHFVGESGYDFEIKDGCGLFVLSNQSSLFSCTGSRITTVLVPLSIGWNMIGWYHDYNTLASSLAGNISGCQMVSWFDSLNQTFKTHFVGEPGYDFTITKGMGLFILVDVASIWYGEG